MLSVPRLLQADINTFVIAIKPERFPEPVVERLQVGRMSLTLSVRHAGIGSHLCCLEYLKQSSSRVILQCRIRSNQDAVVQRSWFDGGSSAIVAVVVPFNYSHYHIPKLHALENQIHRSPSIHKPYISHLPSLQDRVRPSSLQVLLCNTLTQGSNNRKDLLIMIPQPSLRIRILRR